MKSNHSKKRRLNKNTFRKNTRLKRQNMTKKDKKKPKLSRKISRIQSGGATLIKEFSLEDIGGLTAFLRKSRHQDYKKIFVLPSDSEKKDFRPINLKDLKDFGRNLEEKKRAYINIVLLV